MESFTYFKYDMNTTHHFVNLHLNYKLSDKKSKIILVLLPVKNIILNILIFSIKSLNKHQLLPIHDQLVVFMKLYQLLDWKELFLVALVNTCCVATVLQSPSDVKVEDAATVQESDRVRVSIAARSAGPNNKPIVL